MFQHIISFTITTIHFLSLTIFFHACGSVQFHLNSTTRISFWACVQSQFLSYCFTYLQRQNVFQFFTFSSVCSAPPNVLNGRIVNPTFQWPVGTQVTYTCNPGHTIQGQTFITCQGGGQWSQAPVCVFQQPCKFYISFDYILLNSLKWLIFYIGRIGW